MTIKNLLVVNFLIFWGLNLDNFNSSLSNLSNTHNVSVFSRFLNEENEVQNDVANHVSTTSGGGSSTSDGGNGSTGGNASSDNSNISGNSNGGSDGITQPPATVSAESKPVSEDGTVNGNQSPSVPSLEAKTSQVPEQSKTNLISTNSPNSVNSQGAEGNGDSHVPAISDPVSSVENQNPTKQEQTDIEKSNSGDSLQDKVNTAIQNPQPSIDNKVDEKTITDVHDATTASDGGFTPHTPLKEDNTNPLNTTNINDSSPTNIENGASNDLTLQEKEISQHGVQDEIAEQNTNHNGTKTVSISEHNVSNILGNKHNTSVGSLNNGLLINSGETVETPERTNADDASESASVNHSHSTLLKNDELNDLQDRFRNEHNDKEIHESYHSANPYAHNNEGCGKDKNCVNVDNNVIKCINRGGRLIGNKCLLTRNSFSFNSFLSFIISIIPALALII